MSVRITRFFDKLKKQIESNERFFDYRDAAKGMEYNKIQDHRRVSKRLWSIDIARTPTVTKMTSGDGYIDVFAAAVKVNTHRSYLDFKSSKAKGRAR